MFLNLQLMNGSNNTLPRTGLLFYAPKSNGMVDIIGLSAKKFTPSAGVGGKYYADKIDGVWRYKLNSWPLASDTAASSNYLQGVMNDLDGSNKTIIIPPRTYTLADLSAAGGLSVADTNTELRCPHNGDIPYPGLTGKIVFDATGFTDHFFQVGLAGWVLRGIHIKNLSASTKYGLMSYVVLNGSDITIESCSRSLALSGGTITRLKVINCTGAINSSFLTVNPTTLNFPIFDGSEHPINLGNAANTITFNNPIFTRFKRSVFAGVGAGFTSVFNNAIFFGNITTFDAFHRYPISSGGYGTWTFNNCYRGGNARANNQFFANTGTGGTATVAYNNDITDPPKFVSNWGAGKTFFHIDDSENYAEFKGLADLAETYGYRACFAASYYGNSYVNWPELCGYISRGHEVSIHCRTATRLGTPNAFTAAKAGGTLTFSVTRPNASDSSTWFGTATVSDQSPIDLTSASYNTLPKLVAYLAGVGVTIGTATGAANYVGAINGYDANPLCLASAVYDISTVKTILWDEPSLFQVEMTEAKAWIEDQIQAHMPGWTATSLVWPAGSHSANSRAYALSMPGVLQARGVAVDNSPLSALDMGCVAAAITTEIGGNNYETRLGVCLELFATIAQTGSVFGVYAHDFVEAEWLPVFDALASLRSSVTVDTFSGAIEWARDNDDHVTGAISYRCASETESCMGAADYHQKAGSAGINAGVDPFTHGGGDQYDLDGYMVWSDVFNTPVYHWLDGVDIGPYAYCGSDKVYHSLRVDKSWPPFPELYDEIGLDNAVYNADGTSVVFDTPTLALAAMASLADDEYLFGGTKGAALYSVDMSAKAEKIKKILADAD